MWFFLIDKWVHFKFLLGLITDQNQEKKGSIVLNQATRDDMFDQKKRVFTCKLKIQQAIKESQGSESHLLDLDRWQDRKSNILFSELF